MRVGREYWASRQFCAVVYVCWAVLPRHVNGSRSSFRTQAPSAVISQPGPVNPTAAAPWEAGNQYRGGNPRPCPDIHQRNLLILTNQGAWGWTEAGRLCIPQRQCPCRCYPGGVKRGFGVVPRLFEHFKTLIVHSGSFARRLAGYASPWGYERSSVPLDITAIDAAVVKRWEHPAARVTSRIGVASA
jgi:hypothetical protein